MMEPGAGSLVAASASAPTHAGTKVTCTRPAAQRSAALEAMHRSIPRESRRAPMPKQVGACEEALTPRV